MLDRAPREAKMAGYTGHVPGYIPEAMCGKSFAYLTGYRKMLLLDGAAMATEYTRSGREAHRLQPKQVLRKTEDVPRHIVLGMDATTCNRPMSSVGSHQKSKWESKDQFYTTLNLCPTGHMPGYRGHVPQYKFATPGQNFSKATFGRIPLTHSSLSAELYRAG
eukprot:CAMPEP_0179440384 /NCGR_PEP_ID=MMETSP0799-20121207/23972_1 /TAXON_ID=46947 /ORGANISM="Geminigera cryophila, Strain CCMP2564" /LENGTH=162 /DNA_ID=CAMNT_0021223657 /DNA_START=185 /DNA_END=673 /DNA_ORIENTATION=-